MKPTYGWLAALQHFGIHPLTARRIKSGRNTHWLVKTKAARVVLRLYGANCTSAEVSYELKVLYHLQACGWPVAVPLAETLESPAGIGCLFAYVPGRQRVPRTPASKYAEAFTRGRLLARLHTDLAPLTDLGQRERWKTTPEGLFDRQGKLSAVTVLTEYANRYPERGQLLLAYHERAIVRLGELACAEAPMTVIHGDFTSWNMRYSQEILTGIFDFDSTRLDLRVADFALSWRGSYPGVVDGYNDETPLDESERDLIVPVFRAFMVACAVTGIEEEGNADWAIKQLLKQPLTSSTHGI